MGYQTENRAGAQEKDQGRRPLYPCSPQAWQQELVIWLFTPGRVANSRLLLPTLTRQFWNSSEALGPPQSPAPLSWLSPARTAHILSPGSRPGCHQHCGGRVGTLAPRHGGPVWGKQRQVRSTMALEASSSPETCFSNHY